MSWMRRFGNCDFEVSALGLGTVKLGRDRGVKYPEAFNIPDDRAALALLQQARELGINFIDTAPAYGRSEERLGKLLRGQRQHWIVGSKVGEEFELRQGEAHSHFDFTAEHTIKSVERSLQRLATDYLDMVLVHSDGNDLHIIQNEGCLQALEELKQRGLIRAFGMSTKTVEGGIAAARVSDVVMASYNIQYLDEQPVLAFCDQHHVACIIKKALASGHAVHASSQHDSDNDPVMASFRHVFAQAGTTSCIVGTINPQHLTANVEACKAVLESA